MILSINNGRRLTTVGARDISVKAELRLRTQGLSTSGQKCCWSFDGRHEDSQGLFPSVSDVELQVRLLSLQPLELGEFTELRKPYMLSKLSSDATEKVEGRR